MHTTTAFVERAQMHVGTQWQTRPRPGHARRALPRRHARRRPPGARHYSRAIIIIWRILTGRAILPPHPDLVAAHGLAARDGPAQGPRRATFPTRAVCHSAPARPVPIGVLHTNGKGRGVMPARPSYRSARATSAAAPRPRSTRSSSWRRRGSARRGRPRPRRGPVVSRPVNL
jgi:hypothetical protein